MTVTIIVVAMVMLVVAVAVVLVVIFGIGAEADGMQGSHDVDQLLSPIGYEVAAATTYSRL